jgi:glycosyltransferase involved in cell wall biosynthesis
LANLNKIYTLPENDFSKLLVAKKVAIVITVFNQGHLVKTAYNSVIEALQNRDIAFNTSMEIEIILADDCSDEPTRKILKELIEAETVPFKTIISRTPENLGVVGNLNYVFDKLECDFLIILNSDIIVYPGFLKALLLPLIMDEKVGAVTLPEFDSFSNFIPGGARASRLSRFLSAKKGVICCEASTIVSYCVALKFDTFRKSNFLVDPIYGKGYGEDSDLYYYLKFKGLKSLYSLSSLVAHLGGSSFLNERNLLIEKAKHIFFGRWGNFYHTLDPRLETNLEKSLKNSVAGFSDYISIEELREGKKVVGVITPDIGLEIGGLQVARRLIRDTKSDLAYLTNRDQGYKFLGEYSNPSKKQFLGTVMDELHIVGTGSLNLLADSNFFSNNLQTKTYYYFQGFDVFINPADFEILYNHLNKVDTIFVTQTELSKYVDYFAPNVKQIRFKPSNDDLFYKKKIDLDSERNRDVIILLRPEHGKAAWLGESMAQILSAEGFKVTTVGNPGELNLKKSNPNIFRLPGLPWKDLQTELSLHKVFYDPSLYEGYGLTPREALHNGCKVFINSFGDSLVDLANSNLMLTHFAQPFDLLSNAMVIKDYLHKIVV